MEFLRRRLGLIFRALVSILLIAFLVRKIDWPTLWQILRTADVSWLVLAACCFVPVLLIVSWRWRMLLGVHGVHIGFWRIFELSMIGQFFSAFLLGTTGGDVIKIVYVARAVPKQRTAVSFTVIVDRVIGLVALLLFGVALTSTQLKLFLSTGDTRHFTHLFYLLATIGIGASFVACLIPLFLDHQAILALLQKVPFISHGTKVMAAYEKTARALGVNIVALLASLPSHMFTTLLGYCVLHAMHLDSDVPFLPFCGLLAMINMLIALPISISGLGLREWLFLKYLELFHVDSNHAIAFSITYFAVTLLWSLMGAPFYFLYRHQTHSFPTDVAELEPIPTER